MNNAEKALREWIAHCDRDMIQRGHDLATAALNAARENEHTQIVTYLRDGITTLGPCRRCPDGNGGGYSCPYCVRRACAEAIEDGEHRRRPSGQSGSLERGPGKLSPGVVPAEGGNPRPLDD